MARGSAGGPAQAKSATVVSWHAHDPPALIVTVRDAYRGIVEPGSASPVGMVNTWPEGGAHRHPDATDNRYPILQETQGDAPQRNPGGEVHRAVQGIQCPDQRRAIGQVVRMLLTDKSVVWKAVPQLGAQESLCLSVHDRHRILCLRTLELQLLRTTVGRQNVSSGGGGDMSRDERDLGEVLQRKAVRATVGEAVVR